MDKLLIIVEVHLDFQLKLVTLEEQRRRLYSRTKFTTFAISLGPVEIQMK